MSELGRGEAWRTASVIAGGALLAAGGLALGAHIRASRRTERALRPTFDLDWKEPRAFEGDTSRPTVETKDFADTKYDKHLLVVGIQKEDGLNPAAPRKGQRPAVAIHDGDQWVLGLFPEGQTFGNGPVENGEHQYVAAFRLGHEAMQGVQIGMVDGPSFGDYVFRAGESKMLDVDQGYDISLQYPDAPVIVLPQVDARHDITQVTLGGSNVL